MTRERWQEEYDNTMRLFSHLDCLSDHWTPTNVSVLIQALRDGVTEIEKMTNVYLEENQVK